MHQPCRVALLQKLSHEELCCRMTLSVCVVLETCCYAVDSIDVVFVGVCAELVGKVFSWLQIRAELLALLACIIKPRPIQTQQDIFRITFPISSPSPIFHEDQILWSFGMDLGHQFNPDS